MGSTDIFIHVPKAAGTTVRSLIEANYPIERQVAIYRAGGVTLHDYLMNDVRSQLPQAEIVYGHIPVVIHNYVEQHCDYFTFLRDPIERSISFYKYVKHDFAEHPLHRRIQRGEITFKIWCRRRNIESNKQVQMMAGHDRITHADAAMLDAAKETLRNFKYFGFFEDFQQSVQRCGEIFDWNMAGIQVRNLSSRSNQDFLDAEGINAADLECLKKMNQFDVELYDFARELAIKRGF